MYVETAALLMCCYCCCCCVRRPADTTCAAARAPRQVFSRSVRQILRKQLQSSTCPSQCSGSARTWWGGSTSPRRRCPASRYVCVGRCTVRLFSVPNGLARSLVRAIFLALTNTQPVTTYWQVSITLETEEDIDERYWKKPKEKVNRNTILHPFPSRPLTRPSGLGNWTQTLVKIPQAHQKEFCRDLLNVPIMLPVSVASSPQFTTEHGKSFRVWLRLFCCAVLRVALAAARQPFS